MQKNKNEVWAFFASVKLALFTFFILAAASVIGTVIPQGKEMQFYIEVFGPGTAKLFQLLNVPDMYNSWWFVSLLVLFSINLIVCTIDRFPNIWRLVTMDNLALDIGRILKMPRHQTFHSDLPAAEVALAVEGMSTAWKFDKADRDGAILLAAQKGPWTRLGVIAVHLSILVIFIGAIIGSLLGFKGSVMIREGGSAKQIYLYDAGNTPVPLDFEVRCDRFELQRYDTGTPKAYISDLVVIDGGQEILKKTITVNDPLKYKGLTFYQSSYQPLDDAYAIEIENQTTAASKKFYMGRGSAVEWKEEGLKFRITDRMGPYGMGVYRHKLLFNDNSQKPVEFWAEEGKMYIVERPEADYIFSLRPLFFTGLQVAKDPGVWWVYIGCGMMLLGLYVAFFLSHRKVWIYLAEEESGSRLHLSGTSNKNKIGFDNDFSALMELLERNDSLKLKRE
ncbi:MAG: cytochrome c biogenesis protein ResB [Desulfobulbales bacterium]|nr:cytochrome c biogenesis protein ResB [Desulfobulbales bacterium]